MIFMKTHTLSIPRLAMALTIALFLASFCLLAQAGNEGLAGTWNMVSLTPDGDKVPFTLIIKEQEGKLTGTLKIESGEAEAKDFTVTNGVIKFQAPYQGDYYDIELKLVEGKLTGKWYGGGTEGEISGTKA